ncbi:hypothetical protein EUGRSUZ_J01335 [Eucalyptus grandis]|uniref:Uncharacterized protein n=2 Tax=Eucalyptus grandis TaxID=71139 RepID=A0ACC3JZC8_EUCGR|nr:hypothetical protein EUGRSUZ_J01335 [Eucalyptus grandis]
MARHARVKALAGGLSFATSTPFTKLLDSCGLSKPRSPLVFIQNRLIDIYARCGCLDDARRVFDKMPEKNTFTWNAILGYAQHERFKEALQCFGKMHRENYVLNEYSFGSALSACAGLADMHLGQQIQALISKSECSSDVHMGSALIDMYKCGNVACAQKAFDEMSSPNIVSWNSLITCYEQNGPASEALEVFVSMMDCGFEIDEFTLCSRISEARAVFDRMPTRDIVSATSVVSGYAKAASLKTAGVMFTRMMEKNVVSWNALIAGYTQNGENEGAFGLFRLLKREAIEPTHYTFGNFLNACANLADLQLGQQAHAHVLKHGFRFQSGEESNIFVGNSLIDMYIKCGAVEDGLWVFKNMLERDKVSWNAIIVGYAWNGYGIKALQIFRKMLVSGERPDCVTMIRVLCACSHAGLVKEGRHYFKQMVEEYGLALVKDHYIEAKDLIEAMPMQADAVLWGVHKDIMLGKHVADKLLEIDPSNSGPYVLLSNMYAESKKWGNVVRIRKLMRQQGVVKQPGCSWIEIQGQAHEELSELDFMSSEMEMLADAAVC